MQFIRFRHLIAVFTAIPLLVLPSHVCAQNAVSAGAGPAVSEEAAPGISLKLADLRVAMDTDADGFITQEEWRRVFLDADENGDQRLSLAEMEQSFHREDASAAADSAAARTAAFVRLDRSQNDAIEMAEWPGKKRDFRYLDMNRDGVISREEFMSRNARWWNLVFESLDFNGNRMISRDEWMDTDLEFDRLDRNHNGGIERREFYNPR